MSILRDRREFLQLAGRAGIGLAALGVAPRHAHTQPAPDHGAVAVMPLADGFFQVTGVGGNVVVLAAGGRLALVDSGAPGRGDALRAALAERFADAPVAALLNTHWHLDHTGGNDAFGAAGAEIYAHENTRLWMSTRFYVDWQDETYHRRAEVARPTQTFFSSDPQPRKLEIGGEMLAYGHLPGAHTDGDIYVHFPERNVIVAGGALSVGRYPTLDYVTGGWMGGLVDATEKLIGMADSDTLIVPESGPAQRVDALTAQLEMLATVRERIESMAHEGKGIDDMIEANITAEFDARWGNDAELFISNAYESMWWGRMRGIVA